MTYFSKKNTKSKSVDEVVLDGILQVLHKRNDWVGTMTKLNSELTKVVGRKQSKVLPGSPSALRVVVNRVVNRLRSRSVSVKFGRTSDHMRTRFVKFASR